MSYDILSGLYTVCWASTVAVAAAAGAVAIIVSLLPLSGGGGAYTDNDVDIYCSLQTSLYAYSLKRDCNSSVQSSAWMALFEDPGEDETGRNMEARRIVLTGVSCASVTAVEMCTCELAHCTLYDTVQ